MLQTPLDTNRSVQQKISGRLTSIARTQDRYTILGYLSTAAKHGLDKITALRDALTGRPWAIARFLMSK